MANKKISLYSKDELPTWHEMYNEFLLNKVFNYDINNPEHQKIDPYWNRPHHKLLLSWVCNQLNKMVFEDNISLLPISKFMRGSTHIRFMLMNDSILERDDFLIDRSIQNIAPAIYRCKIPSTNEFSIFSSNYYHNDIDDMTESFQLIIILSDNYMSSVITSHDEEFIPIIEGVLSVIIGYYTGGIGWKDDAGNIIPSDGRITNCDQIGYDPAL